MQSVKLNNQEIGVYNLDEQVRRDESGARRVWTFEVDVIDPATIAVVDDLLAKPNLRLGVNESTVDVKKGPYSIGYRDGGGPHHYRLEFVERLPEDGSYEDGGVGALLLDMAKAVFDLRAQHYEKRIRELEARLGIDNSDDIEGYEKRIDDAVEGGWLKAWPERARDLIEVSQTERVKKLLASLPPEENENSSSQ